MIEIFDESQMKDTGNSNLMIIVHNNVTSGYLSEQLASVANIPCVAQKLKNFHASFFST